MAVNEEDVEYKPLLSTAESDGDDEPPPSVKVQSTEDSGGICHSEHVYFVLPKPAFVMLLIHFLCSL